VQLVRNESQQEQHEKEKEGGSLGEINHVRHQKRGANEKRVRELAYETLSM